MYKNLNFSLKKEYIKSKPFKHLIIDNFISDNFFLKNLLNNIPNPNFYSSKLDDYKNRSTNFDILNSHESIIKLFENFYGDNFLSFMDNLCEETLIRGLDNILCKDGTLRGAGIHQTASGGFLGVHQDPNSHHEKGYLRPLNSILFLTPDWDKEDGGFFQLWDKEAREIQKEIAPKFNRLLIFENCEGSYHSVGGVNGKTRISIATFYYSKNIVEHKNCIFPNSSIIYKKATEIRDSTEDIETKKNKIEIFLKDIKNKFISFKKEKFYDLCNIKY
jgi:Rps23 Pro-64 3,4-dihydroxylase Tpa1-like proline 4-hydroxylase